MPYKREWEEPTLFFVHKIGVYHTYEDDDFDQGQRHHYYTLSCTSDEHPFNIRELAEKVGLSVEPGIMCKSGPEWAAAGPEKRDEVRLAWTHWNNFGENEAHKAVLRLAIDKGILTRPTEE
jgi:hypothetical protein